MHCPITWAPCPIQQKAIQDVAQASWLTGCSCWAWSLNACPLHASYLWTFLAWFLMLWLIERDKAHRLAMQLGADKLWQADESPAIGHLRGLPRSLLWAWDFQEYAASVGLCNPCLALLICLVLPHCSFCSPTQTPTTWWSQILCLWPGHCF